MWADLIVIMETTRRARDRLRGLPPEPPDEPPLWLMFVLLFGPFVAGALILLVTWLVTR